MGATTTMMMMIREKKKGAWQVKVPTNEAIEERKKSTQEFQMEMDDKSGKQVLLSECWTHR